MGVQAFLTELAVKRLDEGIVGRFSWSAEVQNNTPVIGPQIQISRNEFWAIVDSNGLGVAYFGTNPFKRIYHILTTIAELHIQNGHITRERINNGQNT